MQGSPFLFQFSSSSYYEKKLWGGADRSDAAGIVKVLGKFFESLAGGA